MTDDELAELAELQRRAYGPDADIAGDPAGQARLAQLQAWSRTSNPSVGTPQDAAHPESAHSSPDESEPAPGESMAGASGGLGVPHADPIDGGSAPAPDSVPRAALRRRLPTLLVLGAAAIVVLAMAVPALIAGGHPVSAPTPSATAAKNDLVVACGAGWGPPGPGSANLPTPDEVVWSTQWDAVGDDGRVATAFISDGAKWYARITPVVVPGGVAAVVQVTSPTPARIIAFGRSGSAGDASAPAALDGTGTDAMLASARRIAPLPACSAPDTYPLMIFSPVPTCVTLRVTLAAGPSYPAKVAVGSRCPRH